MVNTTYGPTVKVHLKDPAALGKEKDTGSQRIELQLHSPNASGLTKVLALYAYDSKKYRIAPISVAQKVHEML